MTTTLRPEDFRESRKPLEEASWLPKHVYLDPEVYALERERIFLREWLFATHISAVEKPGDYITLTLFDEPVIVVRGKDNVIRCLYNVCRHRGMAVAQGSGNARQFLCPYHAWNYDISGQLTVAPAMERAKGFEACDISLKEVRCELINGMVFVNFDDAAEPLAPQIPDLIDIIAPWDIGSMEAVHVSEIEGDHNWKVMLENANENYHSIAVHRESFHTISPAERSYSSDGLGRKWHDLYTPYVGADEMVAGPKIAGVPEWSGKRLSFFSLHPQFLMSVSEDSVATYITQIEGPERTRFVWTLYMPKGKKDNPALQPYIREMADWIDRINAEDLEICLGVQRGLRSDGWTPARYSHLEKPIWQFHNWYLDRMIGRAPALQQVVNG